MCDIWKVGNVGDGTAGFSAVAEWQSGCGWSETWEEHIVVDESQVRQDGDKLTITTGDRRTVVYMDRPKIVGRVIALMQQEIVELRKERGKLERQVEALRARN